MSAVKTL